MGFFPFDANEAIRHRREFAEEGLRGGSPVVGVSFDEGLLLLTVRKTQRKVFEVYDRLIYSAIGNQSDVEAIRVGSIDVTHREGFDRSPDDVTGQRLIGFSLSPTLKRLYGDFTGALPAVIRAMFGEVGSTPEDDTFYILNFDGESTISRGFAAVGGTARAEDRMALSLVGVGPKTTRAQALDRALKAWGEGALAGRARRSKRKDDDDEPASDEKSEDERAAALIRDELKTATLEVGVLDRGTQRESRFRLLSSADLADVMATYR